MIVAADHPARGALGVGDRRLAMANRADLLERLCLALSRPGVDGVLATADILDDLLLLGALDDKVVMGSMNRGGLAGAAFELDDRFTGHRPEDIARLGFDAGKLLLRIDYDDPGSLDHPAVHRPRRRRDGRRAGCRSSSSRSSAAACDGRVRNDLSAEAVTRSIAIASGPRRHLRLHLAEGPRHRGPRRHGRGHGDLHAARRAARRRGRASDQEGAYEKWRKALRLPTVQGLVVGRSLLYPADGDVAAAVDTAVGLL